MVSSYIYNYCAVNQSNMQKGDITGSSGDIADAFGLNQETVNAMSDKLCQYVIDTMNKVKTEPHTPSPSPLPSPATWSKKPTQKPTQKPLSIDMSLRAVHATLLGRKVLTIAELEEIQAQLKANQHDPKDQLEYLMGIVTRKLATQEEERLIALSMCIHDVTSLECQKTFYDFGTYNAKYDAIIVRFYQRYNEADTEANTKAKDIEHRFNCVCDNFMIYVNTKIGL